MFFGGVKWSAVDAITIEAMNNLPRTGIQPLVYKMYKIIKHQTRLRASLARACELCFRRLLPLWSPPGCSPERRGRLPGEPPRRCRPAEPRLGGRVRPGAAAAARSGTWPWRRRGRRWARKPRRRSASPASAAGRAPRSTPPRPRAAAWRAEGEGDLQCGCGRAVRSAGGEGQRHAEGCVRLWGWGGEWCCCMAGSHTVQPRRTVM